MRIAIAQCGSENTGKSTTIRMMYEILLKKYPDAAVERRLPKKKDTKKDIRAVLTIGGIRIGIESQGDPWKKQARLDPSLALFVRLKCEVIVCATRTWGGTLDVVRRLEDEGYTVTERSRTRVVGTPSQERRNLAEANWTIEQIEAIFATATV